jgi:hypothetical protein
VLDAITGAVVSRTVTVELHELLLPAPSVALQLKLVAPSANVPEGGLQTGLSVPGQLSEALGLSVTGAPAGEVHSTTGAPHAIVGGCLW